MSEVPHRCELKFGRFRNRQISAGRYWFSEVGIKILQNPN